jgi:tripartite-type tricarboxylate transporter receptor subunit TctC
MRKRPLALTLMFACATLFIGTPAWAQFYKDRTLTLLVNYGAGGNADTEARVYQRYLGKYIPGNPNIIIQNAPGAGGLNALNMLGLNIGSKSDGFTAGYFTISAIAPIIDDPALKVKMYDFIIVGGARGWTLAYGRKDMPPSGLKQPADLAKATKIFAGGYARSASHDTRLRLALEILGLPYTMVTGFPGTAEINKAMLQNEINFTGSSLPGYQTQVIPQIVDSGIGIPLFHFPVIGPDGKPIGNPALEKQGIATFNDLYKQAFGKEPSGAKFDALLLMNDIGTQFQRGLLLPKGSPAEAVAALREGFQKTAADPDFIADYQKVTGEKPDLVKAEDLEPLFQRIRNIDPAIKKVLVDSING